MTTRRLSWGSALGLALMTWNCSGPAPLSDIPDAATSDIGTEAGDTGGSETAVVCTSAAMCSDGLFCNGSERCMPGAIGADARGCLPATQNACAANQRCDEQTDMCSGTCQDQDNDGHPSAQCGGDDCDDTDPQRYPGNPEVCAFDTVSNTRTNPSHDEDCNPNTYASATTGDGDHDGDGFVDQQCLNRDVNGNTFRGPDCADGAAVMGIAPFMTTVPATNIRPSQPEACNGVDDNCDGQRDEGLPTNTFYPDCDGDNAGNSTNAGMLGCGVIQFPLCMGHQVVPNRTDCDDTRAAVNMMAREVCNGLDDDCNGITDDPAVTNPLCSAMFPAAPNATVGCSAGACGITACATNFGDCNRVASDGCEIDLRTTAAHCGTCATVCGIGSSCAASTCDKLVAIDGGASHTCALYARGNAICWGNNAEGQLGDGTRTNRLTPVNVASPLGSVVYSYIDAGGYRTELADGRLPSDVSHTCAGNGTALYCWGRNTEGQLGVGSTTAWSVPVLVAVIPQSNPLGLSPPVIRDAAVGGTHTIAVQQQARSGMPTWITWSWGNNASGQLGFAGPNATSPGQVGFSAEDDAVTAGMRHSCFINGVNGSVMCIGANDSGQLGVPLSTTSSTTPVTATLPSGFNVFDISAGGMNGAGGRTPDGRMLYSDSNTCARNGFGPGTVYCWGGNSDNQLGWGSTPGGVVAGLTDAVQIAVGGHHACARRATGAIVCWGQNAMGQLGNGVSSATGAGTPVTVLGITNAIWITTGAQHSCALLTDGSAWCWGSNDLGQLGTGTTGNSSRPVRVSGI